ncbi:MAG: hypothetical protein ETSY1_30040 [Candidatus Entotheonella factor]|uniref:Uncharacterized protein n=2 Tax=Candidatus Entotheonella TaxID=93171 RepID=W4LC60_ENTF1|nr:MAG: hypothetical protein ETSY1_30040 [Candidatus Entotheonella factor]
MQLCAEQIVDLVDNKQQHIGQVRVERQEDDLVVGTFLPGENFACIAPLFRDFEEAVDAQALHVIDELDTKIAALGLQLRYPGLSDLTAIRDVQIWSDGGLTCRLCSESVIPALQSPQSTQSCHTTV